MSGRIRSIKPELLDDTKTAGLTHLQFRLFVSLILLSDDYGNLRASAGLLRGSAFWAVNDLSDSDTESALAELEDVGLIETYSMRGQVYAHIKNWAKHQRVDKPGKPRVPSPKDPEVRPARPWVTYFIRLGKTGPIKIGRTFDVAARVRKLQTGAPEKLEVLRVLSGDFEAQLHQRFSSSRGIGEWFDPTPELLEAIAEEPFANGSRTTPDGLVPDLRSPIPISDPDQGSPTSAPPVARESADVSTALPDWFIAAIETVESQTGETIRPPDSWLRYSGHRRGKGISPGQQDAVYWLTTVMVPEARKERRAESDKRERDAKFDAERAKGKPAFRTPDTPPAPYHQVARLPKREDRASPEHASAALGDVMAALGGKREAS